MILYISSAIIFLFVSFNLFFRTDCPALVKWAGCGLVLFASLKYVVYEALGGAFFSPHLPRPLIIALEALYGSLIQLFFLLVLWDIYLAGNWLLGRFGMPHPRHLPKGAIKCGLAALSILLGCWGTWQAIKVPEARAVEIRVHSLPKELDGFTIAQLSDLHIGPILGKAWLAEVVARANALKPDLIALTGDYVDGRVAQLLPELEPLSQLDAKYGVFGVTGNHEYYWNANEWKDALEKLGITMLENSHARIEINGQTLVVAGLPDLAATRFGHAGPDIARALAGAPEAVRLLLAHQPKNARDYLNMADIQLSGHTHGGLMFFLQPLIARFNSGFVSGEYEPLAGKNLYVSPGTGLWNGFSCRVGVPAEITLITLRPRA